MCASAQALVYNCKLVLAHTYVRIRVLSGAYSYTYRLKRCLLVRLQVHVIEFMWPGARIYQSDKWTA